MPSDVIDNYIQLGLLVIAVASVFSPVIVTILNNHHNYKVKKLDSINTTKQEVLANFCKTIMKMFNSQYLHRDFYENLNLLYIYFNVDETLVNRIITEDYKDIHQYQKDVTKLMKSLSKQVNK